MTGTSREDCPILVADSNLSRRWSIRDAFQKDVSILEVERLADTRLERARPIVGVIGRLGEDASAAAEGVSRFRAMCPQTPLVVIADPGNEQLAIASLRARASDYLEVPLPRAELIGQIAKFISRDSIEAPQIDELVGSSPVMQEVRRLIARLAPSDSTVLITGETGCGKELVAAALHSRSRRASRNFVCINCAAIPETLIESELFGFEKGAFTGANSAQTGKLMLADSGTAFLDEIGDMSALAQAKVLRALESREILPLGAKSSSRSDVRFIAATHQNLEARIEAGQFRSDLYYRLNVAHIHVPPLRYRLSDIPQLVTVLLRDLNTKHGTAIEGLTAGALELLADYSWPGNIRQLRNVLEFAVLMAASPLLTEREFRSLQGGLGDALPAPYGTVHSIDMPVASVRIEPGPLVEALQATNWNKSEAAKLLHLSRTTLYRRIAKFRITSLP